jgi:hypothetical protein
MERPSVGGVASVASPRRGGVIEAAEQRQLPGLEATGRGEM